MTTEYYQIPSQQGLLPLSSSYSSADPWLASATSALSLNDPTWGVVKRENSKSNILPPVVPSLFDEDAVSWENVIPSIPSSFNSSSSNVIKAPIVPRGFNCTSSKIDAWSTTTDIKLTKRASITKLQQQQPICPPSPALSTASEDKPIEDELAVQNRYKTELCKSFNETGNCRYGTKCQFAHGKEEVRSVLRHPKYKTETCKTFHTTGTCPYGIRCRFIHTRSKDESIAPMMQQQLQQVPVIAAEDLDDGISLTHPPGIPVPQWSKSWNMSMGSPTVPRKTFRVSSDRLTQPEPTY